MTRKVQLTFVKCPEPSCKQEVQVGTTRCLNGHWIWWSGEKPEIRKSEVRWPMWGKINFQGKKVLRTSHKVYLSPRQSVKVVACEGDDYRIEDNDGNQIGRIHHSHVVIRVHIRRNSAPVDARRQKDLDRLAAKTSVKDIEGSIAWRTQRMQKMVKDDPSRDTIVEELRILRRRRDELAQAK